MNKYIDSSSKSNYNKEIEQLEKECDNLIKDLQSILNKYKLTYNQVS